MEANVGPRERMFRIAIGSAAVTAALLWTRLGKGRWPLAAWGVANVATAITRYCPSNAVFGVDNTRGREFMHFEPSTGLLPDKLAHQLNALQRRFGLTFSDRAA